jgi:hypothetical protein
LSKNILFPCDRDNITFMRKGNARRSISPMPEVQKPENPPRYDAGVEIERKAAPAFYCSQLVANAFLIGTLPVLVGL